MPHLALKRFSPTALLPLAVIIVAALALSGCGRRGSLEAPEGANAAGASSQPGPARLTPGLARSNAQQDPARRDPLSPLPRGAQVEDDEPPIPAPNRPFILDSIL